MTPRLKNHDVVGFLMEFKSKQFAGCGREEEINDLPGFNVVNKHVLVYRQTVLSL